METLFIGKNIIFLPEIESTNSYAIDLLKNVNLPEGTVVHALNQTHGKGQRGSLWTAEPERNMTASFILRPTFLELKNQFFLYQVAALACYDAMAQILDSSQIDIKIKWPNDILVNQKKIAGILIENTIHNGQISWCVAGIGINVNQEFFGENLKAASLKSITGRTYSIQYVLEILCQQLEKHYLALLNSKKENITSSYLKNLFGLNTFRDFELNGKTESFCVKGVGESGLLVLQDSAGGEREMDVKDIKWIY
ncbi:biotin--[acetyl-CoA-carboxylase] ligase [Sphingobacteriaceae bacterium]|nr:biotin--[acetyl-CoA-carboxylase] ligase [Sphingobacteriaceae bacterium]